MSFELIVVFVSSLCSVLCVILRMKQVVLILFQKQNINLYIENTAVMYKGQINKHVIL